MSLYLSSTSLMRASTPAWLEEICQKLIDNDQSSTTLELIHPRIDDVFARELARALEENNVVNVLVLSCFSIVDDGAFAIGTVLGSSKHIQKLQLRDLRNSREVITFFRTLRQNSSIEELSLRHSEICPKGAAAIADFLSTHPGLKEFRLIDCQLLEHSIELITQGLMQSRTLQRLYLVNTEIQSDHAIHIANMLKHQSSLSELYLCENDLGDDGVAVLTAGLLQNTSVRHLDLRSNGLSAEACLSLQGLLVSSRYVVSLSLADNQIGNLGAAALARGVQRSILKRLDLSDNGIDVAGELAAMLRFNTSLQELNLAFNTVGDEGAVRLANMLVRNSTLRLLSLRKNHISNLGARAFAQNLPKMNGLKELLLSSNKIDYHGASAVLKGLRFNVVLEYLHIQDKMSEPISQEIVHWIRLNKAGRRLFRQPNIPSTLWASVYGRISTDCDVLFHFLSEKPEVMSCIGDRSASIQRVGERS